MIIVSVVYDYSSGFTSPENWLQRIRAYTGILDSLAKTNTIIGINRIDFEGDYTHNGVHHKFVNFGKKKNYFPFRFNRFIKELNPDVILLQGLHRPLQFLQLAVILNKNTKIIAQHHAEKPLKGIKKHLQRLADRYIDAYLFASYDMGMDWVKNGNLSSPAKIHEVMEISSVFYPIDKESAKTKIQIKGNPVFLWVGRLDVNKDPLNVIKAFLKFVVVSPGAMLYMIYHTDELLQDIVVLLKDHPNKQSVVLIGKVPNNDLLYWYNSVDFIVSGSHYEGAGTAVCEAMSCGCIPVVTDIFSFRMITDKGNCGILYEPGNETAMLNALLQTQQIDITEKRNASINYFNSTLSFDAIAGRINKIAVSLIK